MPDSGFRNKTQWVPPTAFRPAVEVNASATDFPGADWPMNESGGVSIHETGAGGQGFYTMGLGGPCDEMWPQYGYVRQLRHHLLTFSRAFLSSAS